MDNNSRTAIGYFCVALVFIAYFLMMSWILSPQEFTWKIEMDNNTKEAIESIEFPNINENTFLFNATVNEDIECIIEKVICEDINDCLSNMTTVHKCVFVGADE